MRTIDINATLEEFVRAHELLVTGLTEKQVAEAFRQAIACGDFMRHVRVDTGAQTVTYEPFRRQEELQAKCYELKANLKNNIIILLEGEAVWSK